MYSKNNKGPRTPHRETPLNTGFHVDAPPGILTLWLRSSRKSAIKLSKLPRTP